MKYPKMILFDYGHTLLYEPGWDSMRGNAELLKYVTKNPNNCTLEDVRRGAELIFGTHIENVRKIGYKDRSNEYLPQCEYLHIHEWNEMISVLGDLGAEKGRKISE